LAVRGTGAALTLVVGMTSSLVLAFSGVAEAADGTVESSFAGTVTGPVGLGAVAFGVVGLIAGFFRRRKNVVVSEQNKRVVPPPVHEAPPAKTQV
jgi:hypothetical protein